jgi:hypothetical protein
MTQPAAPAGAAPAIAAPGAPEPGLTVTVGAPAAAVSAGVGVAQPTGGGAPPPLLAAALSASTFRLRPAPAADRFDPAATPWSILDADDADDRPDYLDTRMTPAAG